MEQLRTTKMGACLAHLQKILGEMLLLRQVQVLELKLDADVLGHGADESAGRAADEVVQNGGHGGG